jgi:hypothetical protein
MDQAAARRRKGYEAVTICPVCRKPAHELSDEHHGACIATLIRIIAEQQERLEDAGILRRSRNGNRAI